MSKKVKLKINTPMFFVFGYLFVFRGRSTIKISAPVTFK